MRVQTDSKAETQNLGRALAKQLQKGDVVLLTGPMGAGKSEFARGIADGLGISGPITSPTFTILNVYQENGHSLHHFDWYRIENEEELLESGLDEFIGSDALTLIEWHERAPELLPQDCLEVVITPGAEGKRVFEFVSRGAFRTPMLSESDTQGDLP